MEDRMTAVQIGGKTYKMLFSLAASKAICKKYGSLDSMGDKVMAGANEESIESVSWMLDLLIEQGRLALHFDGDDSQQKLTQEQIETLLTVGDLADLMASVRECITRGTKRSIKMEDETDHSEDEEKN